MIEAAVKHIRLSDHRNLAYAEYGDPNGKPLIYFHGGQESRLSAAFLDTVAREMGLRIIAPDRPGIGYSDPQANRNFADYALDMEELCNQLHLDSVYLLALSGGAPHLLACALRFPGRIKGASIVAGASPLNYKGSKKGMWFPLRMIHWAASLKNSRFIESIIRNDLKTLREKPEARLKQMQRHLPPADRELLLKHPHYGRDFLAASLEAYRQGIEGVVQEWQLYVGDWGFEPSQVSILISLWYGKQDRMAPQQRGFYYHSALRYSRLFLKEEGHFSLIRHYQAEILAELCE
ncbi:alpha/beta fold hydrolase [Croceimicrobium hydrocarbonivorans]|uniref:Alpha/beta hydrolase n=1 Tax=Croceimicrobium hydrocarbonivorans TaxID=2761580 RepID=A0A7H0VIP2_9FLAO|nr:alpha/beta hydrolase [Croceimicrobium hydrocarbonivorans]QNR25590.1 alpha/beta hydrolase [Croceimicrobium hydrocarbonivorans]